MTARADVAGLTRADWLVADELAPDQAEPRLAPFYAAAARGRVALPVCAACAAPLELEQDVCDVCGGGGTAWREVDPRGRVHAVTQVHRREPGLIRATGPYLVIDVEFDSGHRLVLTTTGPWGRPPDVGQAVDLGFRTVGGVEIPAVRPPDPAPRTGEAGS